MDNKTVDFLLIVCHPTILAALRQRLPHLRTQAPDADDVRVYFEQSIPSTFPDGTRLEYRLAIAAPLSVSRAASASLATSAIQRFRPRYVLSLGLAWAPAALIRENDVLIAETIVDSAAASTRLLELGHGTGYPADARLLGAVRHLESQGGTAVPARTAHIVPMVSAESAQAARQADAEEGMERPHAIDLLSAGVARAAHESAVRPGVLVICSSVSQPARLVEPEADSGVGLVDWVLTLLSRGPIPIASTLFDDPALLDAIDFRAERGQHERFVAREEVLTELDRLVAEDASDRGWILLTGAPGAGKSALLSKWLSQREQQGVLTPFHFIRRGVADWAESQTIQNSLAGQILRSFPQLHQLVTSLRIGRDGLLSQFLVTLSEKVLKPSGRRLILVLDGLDEAHSPDSAENPLPRFLPSALPSCVIIVCASRPTHPHLSWIEARLDPVHRIALDSARFENSNERTCAALWQSYAPEFSPPLPKELIDEAVRRAEGNPLHVVKLREWLLEQPPENRHVELIPVGLQGFLEQTWQQLRRYSQEDQNVCFVGLGLLCAARTELSLATLSRTAGWSALQEAERFLRLARPLLRSWQSSQADTIRYSPYHGSFREFIIRKIGPDEMQARHQELARGLAMWPLSASLTPDERNYALRFSLLHRIDAGQWQAAEALVHDVSFLTALCVGPGVLAAEEQTRLVADKAPSPQMAASPRAIEQALRTESHRLWRYPESLPEILYNRLRCDGVSAEKLARQFRWNPGLPPIRLRHPLPERSDDSVRTLAGHTSAVHACAITPDGARVLSASVDGTLRLWDLQSGQELRVLTGHTEAVTGCVITPDGQHAWSVSHDGTLRQWSLTDGLQKSLHELSCGQLAGCSLSADGTRLAIASGGGEIVFLDVVRQVPLWTRRHNKGRVWLYCIALSPDGRRIATGDMDGGVKVFNTETQRELASLSRHDGPIRVLVISIDGQLLLSASHDGTIKVWDLRTGQELRTLRGHKHWVCGMALDAQHIISGAQDRTLKLWNRTQETPLATYRGHALGIIACAITPDGRFAVTGSADGTLKIWDLRQKPAEREHAGHDGRVICCALTADEQRAISGGIDGTLRIWDLTTGDELAILEGHTDTIHGCVISRDGQRAITASRDHTLKVWALSTGDLLATMKGHRGAVRACILSPDGAHLFSASSDGTVRVWDLASYQMLEVIRAHKKGVDALAQSADGRLLITGGSDHKIGVWDWERRQRLYSLDGHEDSLWCVTLSPDGRRLYSSDSAVKRATERYSVRVWDLIKGRALPSLVWHTDMVGGCELSRDGKWLLTCADDHMLTVTPTDSLRPIISVYGRGPFSCIAVGRRSVCAGDSLGNLWMLDLDGQLQASGEPVSVGPGAEILALLRGRREREHQIARAESTDRITQIQEAFAQKHFDQILTLAAKLKLPHLVETELQTLLDQLWKTTEFFHDSASAGSASRDSEPSSEVLQRAQLGYTLFIDVADETTSPPLLRVGQALLRKHFCHLQLQQEREAEQCLREVVRRFEGNPDPELQKCVAMVFMMRARLANARGQDAVRHWFELARRFANSPTGELRQMAFVGLVSCCDELAKQERWAEVVELTKIALSSSLAGPELAEWWADLMHSQAVALAELGEQQQALTIFSQLVEKGQSQQSGEVPAVRPSLVATAMNNRAKLLRETGQTEAAEQTRAALVKTYAESNDDKTRLMVGEARFQQAMSKLDQGAADDGIAQLQELAADLRGATDEELQELATSARYNAAVAMRDRGKIQEATQIFRAISRSPNSSLPRQQGLVASSLYNLAVLLHEEGRLPSALRTYEEVISRFRTHPDEHIRQTVRSALTNKRSVLLEMGRTEQAESVTEQVISHAAEVLSPEAFEAQVQYQFQRAIDLAAKGQHRAAIAICDELIKKYEIGTDLIELGVVGRALVQKGYVLAQIGEYQEALRVMQEVVRRFGEHKEPDLQERVLLAKRNQAGVYLALRQYAEAERLLEEVRRGSDNQSQLHFEHIFATATNCLAQLNGMRGNYREACALYAVVEERFNAVDDPEIQEEVAEAEINHAQLMLTENKPREAIQLLYDASQRCRRYDIPSIQRLGRIAQKRLDALI